MNKTTQISLYSVILMTLFFGIALSYQSCKGEKKEVVTDINAQLENFVDENDSDALLGDDETPYDDESSTDTEASDYDDASRSTDTPSSSSSSTSATSTDRIAPRPSSSSSASTGGYMVIAGNYLVETNAQEMVRKLQNAGYSSAEYAVFDLSQYRTVIAGRYSSRSRANEVSTQLKSRGFDNYVLRSKE